MSDLIITDKQELLNIANAIREKLGTTNQMSIASMPSLISTISGSGSSSSGGTTGGNSSTIIDSSSLQVNPRIVAEFNGTLNDMNSNEEYPSTEWFGTVFNEIELTYGKDYLVEYNGTSYWLKPSFTPILSLAGGGLGSIMGSSPTDFLTLGDTSMLGAFVSRMNAEAPEEGEEGEEDDIFSILGPLLGIIMAIAFGYPIDFDSLNAPSYPFAFINLGEYSEASDDTEYNTIFLVNNSTAECSLKITEFNIDVKNPLNTYLQPDHLQLDKNHPAYIKNKLIGIESADSLFFDGKVEDLSLTAITNDDGETIGYTAPLNEIPMGNEYMAVIFGAALSGNSSTASETSMYLSLFTDRCVVVKYNNVEQVLYPLDICNLLGINDNALDSAATEEIEELFTEYLVDEDGNFFYPFGNLSLIDTGLPNTGENFCVLATFVSGSENDSSETETSVLDFSRLIVVKGIVFTNLTIPLPSHEFRVEYAKLKVLDRKYLPTLVERDLPVEALTYTTAKENVMLKDQVNNYEYLILCKNGILETLCRCSSIAVTKTPNKTSYVVGDSFDPTGMVITATRQDGTTEDISSKVKYSTAEFTSTSSEKEMTITFTEAGHVYETIVTIKVTE